ncbi:MAG: squalene/phytoene synthase family protein, partial [Anaerolineales bacterium]|nr:squalene/phytoene synthase family protein [Anaerolineales bacterium]
AFGLDEDDIERGRVTPNWRSFMAFQIDRNRRLYEEAWPGIGLLNSEGRLAIGAASRLYAAILDDMEAHDYDVFTRRAFVSKRKKIGMIPGIWQEVRSL